MAQPVDAVFFDLYGTLVDLAGLDAACEAAAPGRGTDLAARWRARQLEATWLRTCMGRWGDFAEVTRDALSVAAAELELDPDTLRVALDDAWYRLRPRTGVPDLIERLEAARLPVGILSNGTDAMIRATLDGAGIGHRFAALLSADAARAFKPSPAVYALATAAVGRPAERIGFVTANGWTPPAPRRSAAPSSGCAAPACHCRRSDRWIAGRPWPRSRTWLPDTGPDPGTAGPTCRSTTIGPMTQPSAAAP